DAQTRLDRPVIGKPRAGARSPAGPGTGRRGVWLGIAPSGWRHRLFISNRHDSTAVGGFSVERPNAAKPVASQAKRAACRTCAQPELVVPRSLGRFVPGHLVMSRDTGIVANRHEGALGAPG